ncbi:DUF485 domain-containing protein [Streptomyces rhizosphaerihabitans]|uniref:DUF485 domain-containing protein n=1 Tax=Streptomyces rhizosphaerihabitans TaxID=1266770 RepID=UPI0028F6FA18|nr:DUF485 domain-containing protein [Streptomyces rhizosphaerihabitans]
MPDAFSSPEHPRPRQQRPHQRQYPPPQPPRNPPYQQPYQPYPPYDEQPQQPQQPRHSGYPVSDPDPTSAPAPAPAQLTYPWQPQSRPPEPPPRRMPRHQPLGQHSDIRLLRGAYRRQRRVATLTALGYFTLFLLLSAFAPSLMTSTVSGGLSTGLLLGLLQVPVTCLAIWLYEHSARRRVDPIADRIRKQTELDAKREAAR